MPCRWSWLLTFCSCCRFMTDAARREQESLKKKIQPKLSLTLSSSVSRGNVSTPPRHSSGSLTPPVTPPITPSSSFRSSTPTGEWLDPTTWGGGVGEHKGRVCVCDMIWYAGDRRGPGTDDGSDPPRFWPFTGLYSVCWFIHLFVIEEIFINYCL